MSSLNGRKNEERLYPRVYILIAKKHRALYELVFERVLLTDERVYTPANCWFLS